MSDNELIEIEAKLNYFIKNASDDEFWDSIERADSNGIYSQVDFGIIDFHQELVKLTASETESVGNGWTAIIDLIQSVASGFNDLIPGFAGALTPTFPSMAVQFEGRTIDLSLFKDDEEEAIEVYSDDAGLDGNSLILQSSISGRTIVSEFRKHAATPGMAVKTRFRVPKNITIEEIRSLEPRIEKVV